MPTRVNAGGRLDRLPIAPFHYRIVWAWGIEPARRGLETLVAKA